MKGLWNSMRDTKKDSLLLRTGVSKVKATNTFVLNSKYIKVQHHTLLYLPGKESGYPIPNLLEESSSVSDKKGSLLLLWNMSSRSEKYTRTQLNIH